MISPPPHHHHHFTTDKNYYEGLYPRWHSIEELPLMSHMIMSMNVQETEFNIYIYIYICMYTYIHTTVNSWFPAHMLQMGRNCLFFFSKERVSLAWPIRRQWIITPSILSVCLSRVILFIYMGHNGVQCITGFPQKSQKKVPWYFHDFSRLKPKFPDKKYQYLFLRPMYQFVESITGRHRRTLTHRHRHHFGQGQPTYSTDFISNWTDSRSQNYTC